jgi:hypothetical protein
MLNRIIREPLVHFLALGLLLFVVYGALQGEGPPAPNEIVIDAERVAYLSNQFERAWQRPPTPAELNGLTESWLREEIFYREGLALGLDQGDPVVRRRIAQKMDFISEGLAVAPPDDDELEAYYAEHAARYRVDPVYTLRQVYYDPGRYDDEWAGAVAAARAALSSGEEPEPVGGSLLPAALTTTPAREVARLFGSVFADALAEAPTGRWHGPMRSGYGVHLVFLEDRVAGHVPPLADVRGEVERDLMAERREAANEALYRGLRERYTVRYESPPSDGASGQ